MIVWPMYILSGYYCHYFPSMIQSDIMAIFAIFLILSLQREKKYYLLENSVWAFLGNISFEFYVVQNLVMRVICNIIQQNQISISQVMIYLITLIVVTVIAWMYNRFVSVMTLHKKMLPERSIFKWSVRERIGLIPENLLGADVSDGAELAKAGVVEIWLATKNADGVGAVLDVLMLEGKHVVESQSLDLVVDGLRYVLGRHFDWIT